MSSHQVWKGGVNLGGKYLRWNEENPVENLVGLGVALLQLAAAALGQVGLTSEEVAYTIDSFRNTHMSELSELAMYSRSSIGYGFPSTPSGSAAGSAATLVDDEDQPAATIGTSEAVP
jgi:hypothetical protein